MAIKFWPLLLSFLSLLPCTVKAQKTDSAKTYQFISLQFGINQIKDENLLPKVSTGTITELSYGFEKRKLKLQQFHFTVGYSRLKTEFEDLSKTANLELNMDYNLGCQLAQKNNFTYYLGPELRLSYNACYFPNWDDSHLYWADHLSIGAQNNFLLQFKNKNTWLTSISMPLFSIFSRPELYRLYKIDDIDFAGFAVNLNSNITAAHLTNVFYLNLQSEYCFPAFENKSEAFTYTFKWLRVKHDEGNPFNQVNHQIGIKFFL